jgi:hypothetical protein
VKPSCAPAILTSRPLLKNVGTNDATLTKRDDPSGAGHGNFPSHHLISVKAQAGETTRNVKKKEAPGSAEGFSPFLILCQARQVATVHSMKLACIWAKVRVV